MFLLQRLRPLLIVAAMLVLVAPFGAGPIGAQSTHKLNVATTVAPLTDIALNVGGTRIALTQIVPSGTDSHTFQP
jgi:ABC-type Zn uptake system ZnuABC Zn-binding protein ZnuA